LGMTLTSEEGVTKRNVDAVSSMTRPVIPTNEGFREEVTDS
jgi:hypothetical protein